MLTLKINCKYCIAFYCVIMLYASLHELVHHFTGAAICGDWGYKTFNYFRTACQNNRMAYLATYAGPLFSFVMMWVGAWMLKKESVSVFTRHMAFAIIFAQLPLQRMVSPFFKMNDEYYASAALFGDSLIVYWSVILIVCLCCIPPLLTALNAIANRRKVLWFLFYLLLFPYLLWGPVFGVLEYLLVSKHVMDGTVFGIANLFVLNEIITIIGYCLTRKYLDPMLKED